MSDIEIAFALPIWLSLLLILLAFAVAVWVYRTTTPPVPPLRRWSLIALRTIGITALLLALLDPLLTRSKIEVEDPRLLVALDTSESMSLGDFDSTRIVHGHSALRSLLAAPVGENGIPVFFADSTSAVSPDATVPRAEGSRTNLAAPFDLLADSLERSNLRAMVLITDGRYNEGANPLATAERLGLPVFAIGTGDTVEPRDAALLEIFTNEYTWVNSELPIQARVRISGFSTGTATVTLAADGRTVDSRQIPVSPGSNIYSVEFSYTPTEAGTVKLTTSVSPPGDELTTRNNSRSEYVRVRPNERDYVIVAGGPSPDLAFIRRLLTRDPASQVRTFIQRDGQTFLEGNFDPASLDEAEALVLVGYPSVESAPGVVSAISEAARSRRVPILAFAGPSSDYGKLALFGDQLPITVRTVRQEELMVQIAPTDAGSSSPILSLGTTGSWSELPPVFRSETTVEPRADASVLAVSSLSGTLLDQPLIVSGRSGDRRSLFVAAYGLFRWQLVEGGRAQVRGAEPIEALDRFVSNTLRWLSVTDEDQQVTVRPSREVFNLGEPVRLLGTVYNDAYEPISDADLQVTIRGNDRSWEMQLASIGGGRYDGRLSALPAGDYSFSAVASVDGRRIGTDVGRFSVADVGIEFSEPTMNVALLREIAERTGGGFYRTNEIDRLLEELDRLESFAPRSVESRQETSLRELIWLLLVAIAAFALEWFLRKRSGMI